MRVLKAKVRILAALILPVVAGMISAAAGEDVRPRGSGFHFLPAAGLLVEGAAYSGSEAEITGHQRKILDLHVINYGKLDLSIYLTENTLATDRNSARYYPYRIDYVMDYFYLSWRIAGTRLGVLMDHICHNVIDKTGDTDPEQLRWYGAGIKWESLGMKTGMKDHTAPFESPGSFALLSRLQYMLYAGASLHTERFKYAYIARGALRFDAPAPTGLVPYLEGSFQALGDYRLRVDRAVEAGVRFRLADVNITPFLGWSYRHDALLYEGGSDSAWLAGLRMESLLGPGLAKTPAGIPGADLEWPGMHFRGGYGKYAGSGMLGYLTELEVRVDLARFRKATLYAVSDLAHASKNEGNALYPRYLEYGFQGGADYAFSGDLFAGMLYEHGRRHDGNDYRGASERYHLAGVTAASRGMRLGNVDRARSGPGGFFPNAPEWRLFAGRIFDESHYPYEWDLRAAARLDIARYRAATPYVSPDVRLLTGREPDREFGIESGVRFSSDVALILYHRYEKAIDIDAAGGVSERRHVAGFRVER